MTPLVDLIATTEDAAVLMRHRTRVGRSLAWRHQDAAIAAFFSAAFELAGALRRHLDPERTARVRRWICYGDTTLLPVARMFAARRATSSLIADLLGWPADPTFHLVAPTAVVFDLLDDAAAGLCEPEDRAIAVSSIADLALEPDDVLMLMPGTDLGSELLGAGPDHPIWRHVDAGGEVVGLCDGLAQMTAVAAIFELFGDALRQPAALTAPNFEHPDRPSSTHAWHLGPRIRASDAHPDRIQRVRDLVTLAWAQPIPDDDVARIGQASSIEPSMRRLLWGYWANVHNGRLHLELGQTDPVPRPHHDGWFVGTGQGVPLSVMADAVHPADPLTRRLQWAADVFGAAGPMPMTHDFGA